MSGEGSARKRIGGSVWRAPLLLLGLSVFGLLASLLGTGLWHVAAWLALAVPIVVTAWYALGVRFMTLAAPRGDRRWQ